MPSAEAKAPENGMNVIDATTRRENTHDLLIGPRMLHRAYAIRSGHWDKDVGFEGFWGLAAPNG
jgi:hypothetical protein